MKLIWYAVLLLASTSLLAIACGRDGGTRSQPAQQQSAPAAQSPPEPCQPIEVIVGGETYYPVIAVMPAAGDATVTIIQADGTRTLFRKSQVTSVSTKGCPGRNVECLEAYSLDVAEGRVTVISDGTDDSGKLRWREVGGSRSWLTDQDYFDRNSIFLGTACEIK